MVISPKKPIHAYLDLDMVLFAAASKAEQVFYDYCDSKGNLIESFKDADQGKKWLANMEMFGFDSECVTRETRYEIGDLEDAKKAFDKMVERWVKLSGCKKWTGYVSKATGAKNFRYSVCFSDMYKGNRNPDTRKPYYLEDVRKHALTNPNIKKGVGGVEVDDLVLAMSQRKGERAIVIGGDKDIRTCVGTWFLIPDEMEEAEFSLADTLGYVYQEDKKIKGCGYLFLISQAIWGDSADNYKGCKGVGVTGTVKLLEPFNNKPVSMLEDVVKVATDKFMEIYGDRYELKHCSTGEDLCVSGKDIFIENLTLAYMKKSQNDVCPLIEIVEKV